MSGTITITLNELILLGLAAAVLVLMGIVAMLLSILNAGGAATRSMAPAVHVHDEKSGSMLAAIFVTSILIVIFLGILGI
jgi:hypothetical protein